MVFQLGSALLDACVLAILQKEDAYGYKLTQEAKIASDYFYIRAIFAVVGFISALGPPVATQRRRPIPG